MRAVQTLESLELTPETEAQWQALMEAALTHNRLVVAERCAAAMGDIAKARFLHKVRGCAALPHMRACVHASGRGPSGSPLRCAAQQLGVW